MKNVFTVIVLIVLVCSCSYHQELKDDFIYEEPELKEVQYFYVNEDSLNRIILQKEIQIDSLLSVIERMNFTKDSLSQALEISNNRVAVNLDFQIPDSIVFAGRIFDLTNERIYNKFEKIYKQELKSAHKFIPRSGKYFAIFDSIFAKHNIPIDTKYLAIAESRLSCLAHSRVGADGIWQFMPKTAKGFGLKINSFIDERRDVFKSTEAAAKFLQNNYDFLSQRGAEDWLLAMSAYNAGAGNITKVMRKQGGKDFFHLIMQSDESHNFVWRAVASKLIMENEEEIFGKKFEREKPLLEQVRLEKIKLNGHYKIDDWSKAQGTFVGIIWEYNPWIKIYQRNRKKYSAINNVVLPPGEYTILLPKNCEKNDSQVAIIEKQFLNKNAGYFTHHIVKKGDTLYDIAVKYKTTVSKIKMLNGLTSNIIRPVQKLKLYGSTKSKSGFYIVKKGDYVAAIARKLGTSSRHLIQRNNLKNKNGIVMIYPGQKLYY